jgi:hypothetical protein
MVESTPAFYWIEPNVIAEDRAGQLVAGRLESPTHLLKRRRATPQDDTYGQGRPMGRDFPGNKRKRSADTNRYFETTNGAPFWSWPDFKHQYSDAVSIYVAALQASASPYWLSLTVPLPFNDGAAPHCAVPDPQGTPHYSQVHSYTGPNNNWYASGCGPTAWAILIGWEDRQAARGDPRFAPYWALYHKDGALDWFAPDDVAPMSFDPGPQNMAMQLNRILGTWGAWTPGESEGVTEPWRMSRVDTYLEQGGFKDHSIEAVTFDWGGGEFDSLRDRAAYHICVDQVPAVMGLGALSHYAVATETFGYWFYMNMGHGGDDDNWGSPGVFFAGTILPKHQPVLAPGYLIAEGGECLEIQEQGTRSGDAVLTTDCGGRSSQRWLMMGDSTVRGINGQCLDVDHQNSANGTKIQNYDCNGTVAQAWSFESFKIRQNDFCIDVAGMVNADGTPTQAWGCLGFWNQRWSLTPTGEIANSGGRCLDVSSGDTSNGASVDIASCDGSAQQKWAIGPGGQIRGLSGKCLTAWRSAPGAPLVMWDCGGQPLQQWALAGPMQGFAGKCLDITGGSAGASATNGQAGLLWDCTGAQEQEWTYAPY